MNLVPTVSAIIYCDGCDEHVWNTLDAIIGQTLSSVEIIVAGNVPTASLPLDVRVLSLSATIDSPRRLPPSIRNLAVAESLGTYFVELVAGDLPQRTMFEKCAWALRTREETALVLVESDAANLDPLWIPIESVYGSQVGDAVHGAVMVRRRAWENVGRFTEDAPSGAVDADWCFKAVAGGWSVARIPERLVRFRAESNIERGFEADQDLSNVEEWLKSRHKRAFRRAEAAIRHRSAWGQLANRVALLRMLSDRILTKLQIEGITGYRQAMRHPLLSLVRLLPGRLKGSWWDRLGLPRPALDMWEEIPELAELPAGPSLSVKSPRIGDDRVRVLIVHPYLVTGGAETLVLNLVSYLDRTRFDVHLITTEGGQGSPEWMNDPWLEKFSEQLDSIYRLPAFLNRDHFLRFLLDFVDTRRIDVLLISISVFAYRALPDIIKRSPDTAVLDLLHAEAPYAPLDQITLASWYREFLDLRVVTTETVRSAQLLKYGEQADRVIVIPNGVDTIDALNPDCYTHGHFRREFGINEGKSIVLFFGRLVDEKQPMHIIEVAERLHDRKDIVFVVMGEGPEEQAVTEAVIERGLTNVLLRPPCQDIAVALIDANLVFFPSKREGLPMSGIEALSMATPVVAARVPGWMDLVEDGIDGFLVDDGDFDGYAQVICRLIDDGGLNARMSVAGRAKAIKHYDVRTCVRAWERTLRDAQVVHYR